MLEVLNPATFTEVTYRYQTNPEMNSLLKEMGLDASGNAEVIDLLKKNGEVGTLEKVLDEACKPKSLLPVNGGRFSDGSIGVCYTALETDTAQLEAQSYQCRIALRGMTEHTRLYYQQVSIDFGGRVKDLRPKESHWQFLVSATETGYPDCRALGREAIAEKLDGLLTPSSRRQNGTCLPVFSRLSLQNPRSEGIFEFHFNPGSGSMNVSTIA